MLLCKNTKICIKQNKKGSQCLKLLYFAIISRRLHLCTSVCLHYPNTTMHQICNTFNTGNTGKLH